MSNKAKSISKIDASEKRTNSLIAKLNSRVFLASSQCLGDRNNYLFAFGAEL